MVPFHVVMSSVVTIVVFKMYFIHFLLIFFLYVLFLLMPLQIAFAPFFPTASSTWLVYVYTENIEFCTFTLYVPKFLNSLTA